MSWDELFERANARETTIEEIRETLEVRRNGRR